ncbi:MAG: hypothetical protein AAF085_05825 [Planctomycetota bacterium]
MKNWLLGWVVLGVLAGCETVPQQVLPYILADGQGGADLHLYDVAAGTSIPLKQTPGVQEADPAVDFTGQRVAYVTKQGNADQFDYRLSTYDLQTGLTAELLRSTEPIFSPVFSNDAKQLAYVLLIEGRLQIQVKDLTSDSEPKTIGFGSSPSWRIDDRAIFYSSRDTLDATSGELMVHELKTGLNQSLALRGNGFANLPRGTSVVYTALPYSRRNDAVWLIDANSRQSRLSSPGKTSIDSDPVHINGTKFVAFTRTEVATGKASIYVVQRFAENPVEALLFEAEGNAYTARSYLSR